MSESVLLAVTGIKCGGCESNITGKLTAIDGVLSVTASHQDNTVAINFEADKTNIGILSQIITDAGFTVES